MFLLQQLREYRKEKGMSIAFPGFGEEEKKCVNCKTKFHSQILKLEINLSKKHWRLILPKKDYNSYHWFSTCCSGQNRGT